MAQDIVSHETAGVSRFVDLVDRACGALARMIVLATGSLILIVLTANVVARYVLASGGFRFAQELPERIFPWFIMAGVVLAVQQGRHLAVETLYERLDERGRRILLLIGYAIIIASYAALGREALIVADIVSIDFSPVLGMPMSYGYYALAVGCLGVVVATAAIAIRVAARGASAAPSANPAEQPT